MLLEIQIWAGRGTQESVLFYNFLGGNSNNIAYLRNIEMGIRGLLSIFLFPEKALLESIEDGDLGSRMKEKDLIGMLSCNNATKKL